LRNEKEEGRLIMQSYAILQDKHKGRPAVILGAGPSLPAQLETIPKDAVLLSVNDRPAKFVKCDYIIFLDENTGPFVEGLPGKRVSLFEQYSDYMIEHVMWKGSLSGMTAMYLACFMGCAPVILAGFDCYQGDHQYFDEAPGEPFIGGGVLQWSLDQHLKEWRRAAGLCPNSEVVRAAGGPLVEVFGRY